MITLSVCVSLILLAIIAAVFGQQHSSWVLDTDRDRFFPPFFLSEGFYRAFLINLSFAGISAAAGAVQFVRYASFWMVCDPFLAILLNLSVGLFAALALSADSKEFKSSRRRNWTIVVVAAGVLCFGFAVWATAQLAGPGRLGTGVGNRQFVFTFSRAPADDSALRQWFEMQPDTSNVGISRDNQQVVVDYTRDRPMLGPSEKELQSMGYDAPSLVELTFADQPLAWWFSHLPPNAWIAFSVATLLAAFLLSLLWNVLFKRPPSAVVAGPPAPEPEAAVPAAPAAGGSPPEA